MKKAKIYLYCLCMAIMMLLMSSNVYGATLKSATVSKTKTYRWDLTHDGKADSVKFVIAKDNYNMINKLQIHVNGKKAYSISDLYVYRIQIQYVKISNSKEFLYVVGRGDSNTPYIRKIFRYDTASQKLVEAADLSQYSGAVRGIKKVSGNRLTIAYECGISLAGRIKWNYIYEYNSAKKKFILKSSELSQLYDVSEETIRRDLDKLEKEGLAIKSYGGAVINEDVSIDLPFNVRKNQNVTGKQKMAELAASLVKDGDHIFLDASTTAVFVAKALKEKERLTVITNSMEILLELADVSGWNIISTGGVMKEGYLAFLGSKTDESIRSYYVDKVIFSCKALDLEWGIMESQEAFGSTKRAMIGSGRKKILVVDSSKFDQTAFSVAGSMKEVDIIVTDKEPTERWKKHFEKFNVKCLYPV